MKFRVGGKDYTIDISKLVVYVGENWGAPFIIAFMVMLMFCAGMLAFGNEALANDVAVYAYYMLVFGVALQLAAFIRDKRRKGRMQSEAKTGLEENDG